MAKAAARSSVGRGEVRAEPDVARDLLAISDELTARLARLKFCPPVTHVYCPLEYAREVFANYVRRYADNQEVVLLGMNPGPWGMAQTGVPFGEVNIVRDWLGLCGRIDRPRVQHPKVPIMGWDCHRCEVSGSRLWGWARDMFKAPARFFRRFFVLNYCPLIFLEEGGRNRTPDKLLTEERSQVAALCDSALRRTIEAIAPTYVVGVGNFAESRARAALDGMSVTIGRILHPSPASPAANGNWAKAAVGQLRQIGIQVP